MKNKYEIFIKVKGQSVSFYSKNDNKNNLYNILATIASISLYINVKAFKKDIFGAPTFVVNNKIFWGQDRLDYALDEYNS